MRTLLLLLAAIPPAMAQGAPRLLPTRDVVVVYTVQGAAAQAIPGGIPSTLRLSWDAGLQRLRAEADGRTQALLLDLGAKGRAPAALVVDRGLRTALSLPVRGADLEPLTLHGARLTRRGTETVAGLACTDYAVQAPRGNGTVCLTADGVALRAAGDIDRRRGSFTAVSVHYGPLPPALFEVPRGYFQLTMPSMNRAG